MWPFKDYVRDARIEEESLKVQCMSQKRLCKDCEYYLYIHPRWYPFYTIKERFLCTRNRKTIITPNLIIGFESKETGEFLDCKIERNDNCIGKCGIAGRFWKLYKYWQVR